jgi:hypothetical protein
MGAMAWRFGQELVDTCGFAAGYKSVNRFVGKLRGQGITGSLRGDRDRTRRRAAGGLRHGPDGARPAHWQVPSHTALRADSRLQSEVRPLRCVAKTTLLANRTNRQSLGYRLFSFQSEDFPDELNLPKDIPFRQPPHLAFPDHVQNLVALNRPPGSIERSKTLAGIHPPLDPSMVLFHNIV